MGEKSNDRSGINYPKFGDEFSVLDFSKSREVPVISLFDMPEVISKEESEISVCGLDCNPKKYNWEDLQSIRKFKPRMPLICQIFNWGESIKWEGWKLKDVLESMDLTGEENKHYAFYSRDGNYFETLTHEEAMDKRSMIAYRMNGKDLSHEHGGPLRLVVPFLQGYKSIKWLNGIRSFKENPLGIKILLKQSKTAKLANSLKSKYGLK